MNAVEGAKRKRIPMWRGFVTQKCVIRARRVRISYWGGLLTTCVLILAACGGSTPKPRASAPITAPSTTSTTLSYAVPQTIDATYLNRVMAAINHVRGNIRRDTVKTHTLSDVDKSMLGDIYADKALEGELNIWSQDVQVVNPQLKVAPGDEVDTVQTILHTEPTCVVFTTTTNVDSLNNTPQRPTGPWVIALWTFPGIHDSNPTPWKVELDVHQGTVGSDYRC